MQYLLDMSLSRMSFDSFSVLPCRENFSFDKEQNVSICPAGKVLTTTGKLCPGFLGSSRALNKEKKKAPHRAGLRVSGERRSLFTRCLIPISAQGVRVRDSDLPGLSKSLACLKTQSTALVAVRLKSMSSAGHLPANTVSERKVND